jgi:hypothetical protein
MNDNLFVLREKIECRASLSRQMGHSGIVFTSFSAEKSLNWIVPESDPMKNQDKNDPNAPREELTIEEKPMFKKTIEKARS